MSDNLEQIENSVYSIMAALDILSMKFSKVFHYGKKKLLVAYILG